MVDASAADEAVSPLIATIILLAICALLGAAIAVWSSELNKPSEKAEDAAFGISSPITGQVHVVMIRMGEHGPYSLETTDAIATDDAFVSVDEQLCDVRTTTAADEEEFASLTGFPSALPSGTPPANGEAGLWSAGETMVFSTDCSGVPDAVGTIAPSTTTFTSSTEHRIRVTVRGVSIFESNVFIR